MPELEPVVPFHREPLRFLDQQIPTGDAFRLEKGQLCLTDAAASRTVWTHESRLSEERSDFFLTRKGLFGPRAPQVEMGRAARAFLRSYLGEQAGELRERVRQVLGSASEGPDAGNWLVYRHMKAALIAPDSPARLLSTLDEIVERVVLAGARERYSLLAREVFRFRVKRELARAVEERRARRPVEPADVLDVLVQAAGPRVPAAELVEVFLSFLFAVAGSVGFTLGLESETFSPASA